MITDLKPYEAYKESGLAWLGQVPAHWDVRPAFGVFVPNQERNDGMKEKTVLSLSYGRIVIKPAEKLHGLVPKSFETYQIVNPGDIVLRTTDLQNDHTSLRVGMVRDRGIITSAYLALRVKADVNPEFGFQFLNVWDGTKAIYGYGSGLRQNLDFSHFKRMSVALPQPAEQSAIVRFLNWANGRLERTIQAKKKVAALLNEQKQVVIHCAVTRGLDSSIPFKPSGIPWLGDIPQHWELRKVRHLSRQVVDGTHFTPAYRDDGIAFLRVKDIHNKVIDQSKLRRISKEEHLQLNKRCNPEKGDLLLSKNGTIGLTTVVDWDFPFSIFVSLCLIKPIKSLVSADFISFAFAGGLLMQQLADNTKTTSVTNLHLDKIRGLLLPLPPLCEQLDILTKTVEDIAPIERAISRLKREIELLREYRTRLVADVVTGKVDVRAAAARLPEKAAPDVPPDDTELIEETEPAEEEVV